MALSTLEWFDSKNNTLNVQWKNRLKVIKVSCTEKFLEFTMHNRNSWKFQNHKVSKSEFNNLNKSVKCWSVILWTNTNYYNIIGI